MKSLLFSLVLCLTFNEVYGIYGGCMSYSSSPSDVPGHIEVKLSFLNGWKLHRGPCDNCTENDEGLDVTERRKKFINVTNNPEAFGSWTFERGYKGNKYSHFIPITLKINRQIRDVVLMVNKHEGWELENSEINLLVDINTTEKHRFDIMFTNINDGELTGMNQSVEVFLQVKVDPYNRTDTKKPNFSPVILVKPYYSLELSKIHTIHIPAVDNDDDKVKCELSTYIEAGVFVSIIKNLTRARIIAMKEKEDCVLTINLNTTTSFSVGDTFALPITVKDYSRKYIETGIGYSAYKRPIGRVTVLMYFKVTGRTDPPKFIPPTPPNNQAHTVYVGVDFNVSVYAKPTDNTRQITKLNFLRRDGISVKQTVMRPVPGDPHAVYISMGWSPVKSDIGKHLICANAEDSKGVSTVELHCFKIDVKASIFRQKPAIAGKPYFASIPNKEDIVCPIGSYCVFPVYAATENLGGIEQILRTDMSQENVTIQYSSDVINKTVGTKVAQVQFLAVTPGLRQICLNATDRFDWTVRCLFVTVERQAIGFCDQKPCVGTSDCVDVGLPPYFMCICPPGKTGIRCDVDIDFCNPTPCNENDICQQDNSTFQCQSGHFYQQCPDTCSNSDTTVCVGNECICALKMNKYETCMSNQTDRLNISSNKNPYFISPSIGSVETCDTYESRCVFPVYIFSESTPKLSVFTETNAFSFFIRKISILPPVHIVDGYYSATTVLSKSGDYNHIHHEFDLCLNVAKNSS